MLFKIFVILYFPNLIFSEGINIHDFHFRYHRQFLFKESLASSGCSEESYFSQILDHFDNSTQRTWEQLVRVNSKYFNPKVDEPVIFLEIGGESDTSSDELICYDQFPIMKLAIQSKALIIKLEHRFFGKSWPLKNSTIADMSLESLQYLSPQQALEDLANFIRNFKYQNLDWKNPRWIIFGGSYPGSLCAWSRAMYPDLTVGGICSSAPLLPKFDFFEYADVMEYAITNYSLKKYPRCADAVKSGMKTLQDLTYTYKGRNMLNKFFNITPPLNPKTSKNFNRDATSFLKKIFGTIQQIVQYDPNDIIAEGKYNIKQLCKQFSQSRNPLQAIKHILLFNTDGNQISNHVSINYENDIKYLSQTSFDFLKPDQLFISYYRGWEWLTCGAGLGWLQTTDQSNGMFNQMSPISYSLQMCSDIFGKKINSNFIAKKVAEMGYQFPAPWNYSASNVILTNGDYDPWHALGSFKTDESKHQIAMVIHGSAHCAEMNPPLPGEPSGLAESRAMIEKEVQYYLTVPMNPGTSTSTTTTTTTNTTSTSTTSTITSTSSSTTLTSPSTSTSSSTTLTSTSNKTIISTLVLLFSMTFSYFLNYL